MRLILVFVSSLSSLLSLCVACGPTPVEVSLEDSDMTATFSGDDVLLTFAGIDVEESACPTLADDAVTFAGGAHEVVASCEERTLSLKLTADPVAAPIEGEDPVVTTGNGEVIIESGGGTAKWGATNLLVTRRFVRADSLEQVPRGLTLRVNFEPYTDVVAEPDTVELRDGADALVPPFRLDGSAIAVDIPGEASPGPQTLAVSAKFTVPTIACEGFASCTAGGAREELIDITIAP
jgi:hypothetical protein